MDNIREKLVELLNDAIEWAGTFDATGTCYSLNFGVVADVLIANGVTVQEWIPVTERLPTEEDANEFGEILTVTRNGTITPYYYDRVAYFQKDFPYWMPWSALPLPPKGE